MRVVRRCLRIPSGFGVELSEQQAGLWTSQVAHCCSADLTICLTGLGLFRATPAWGVVERRSHRAAESLKHMPVPKLANLNQVAQLHRRCVSCRILR